MTDEEKRVISTLTLKTLIGGAVVAVTLSDGKTDVTPAFTLDGYSITGTAGTPQVSGTTSQVTYSFSNLATGNHTIAASADKYDSSTAGGPITVTVATGATATGSITLTRQTGSVAVTVIFSDGATNVTPNFILDMNPVLPSSYTKNGAIYTFPNLAAGNHTIAAGADNYDSSSTAGKPLTVAVERINFARLSLLTVTHLPIQK